MTKSTQQAMELASIFGCTLNGRPARLDVNKGTVNPLLEVRSAAERMVVTPKRASDVMIYQQGFFRTFDVQRRMCV